MRPPSLPTGSPSQRKVQESNPLGCYARPTSNRLVTIDLLSLWSGYPESNRVLDLGKIPSYHLTLTAWWLPWESNPALQCFKLLCLSNRTPESHDLVCELRVQLTVRALLVPVNPRWS